MKRSLIQFLQFAVLLAMIEPGLAGRTARAALVSHWALDEGAGIIAVDSGPAHNAGTLTNSGSGTIGWTNGVKGSAVALTGNYAYSPNGGFVTMGNAASLNFESTNPFSVSAWMKTPAGFNQDATIAGKMVQPVPFNGKYLGYELHYSTGTGVIIWLINTFNTGVATDRAIQVSSDAVAVNDGNWHQVAFTYNGSGLAAGVTIYIDGIAYPNVVFADSLGTNNTMLNNVSFNIGSRDDAADHNFTGSIDDVQVYNRALTSAQMLFLYQHSGTSINASVIDWVYWTNAVNGVPGTAKGTISATGVGITYAGEIRSYVSGLPSWGPVTTYSGGAISNPPPSNSGIIQIYGGNASVNTITFSQPVVNPVMAIWSLGNRVDPAVFAFPNSEPVTIESGGPSSEFGAAVGGSTITLTNNIIYGTEGNGTIQIHGTFTQISWTNPIMETWFGYTVGVPENLPPVITGQPTNYNSLTGGNASFSVAAAGAPLLTYQWFFNNVLLTGATNRLLIFTNIQATNAGSYQVIVGNAYGSVTSSVAVLTVHGNVPGMVVAWGYNNFGQTNVPAGLSNVVAIAAGGFHSLALKNDGTMVAWGDNDHGETNLPAGLSGVTDISAKAAFHNLALKSDGTVVAWGYNTDGETNVPAGLIDVAAIAAGNYHNLALKSDGTVVAWGNNSSGQTNVPSGLSGVTTIAGGGSHSAALKNNGTVVVWGDNSYGETNIPSGLSNVTAIAAGFYHNLALKSDGIVVAWGNNSSGQTNVPAGLTNVTAIAAGNAHSVALRSDGTVVAWGDNSYGETNVPSGLTNVLAIAAGGFHTLAIISAPPTNAPAFLTQPQSLSVNAGQNASFTVTAAGTAPLTYQWYYNANAALAGDTNTTLTLNNVQTNQSGNYTVVLTDGYGRSVTSSVAVLTVLVPVPQPGIVLIAGGDDFSLYGSGSGNLWAMGDNYAGQLGDGTDNNIIITPELIVGGGGIALAAGNNHSLFIKSGGSLWAAGDNTHGQLGDGTYNPTNRPELIVSSSVMAIAAGFSHSLFIKNDGSLWSMGDNSFGQLGDGTDNLTNRPEQIVSGGVTAIAGGYRHSLFLKSDGSLWGIGGNNYGQLGDGTGNNAYVPEPVLASNVTAIAAGGLHSLLLKRDGSLWAMGDNEYGQLGDGTGSYKTNQPEMIVSGGVTAIAAGFYHSLFLKSDGSLWAMGNNNYGQLGDGTFEPTNQPQLIVSGGVTAIAAGFYHSLFVKSDGSLWVMGYNEYGELGDGYLNDTNRPEQIVAGVTGTGSAPVSPFFSAVLITNGCFQATLNGTPTSNYMVYVSSNLVNWPSLKTVVVGAGGTTNVTDTNVSLPVRFYRAKLYP